MSEAAVREEPVEALDADAAIGAAFDGAEAVETAETLVEPKAERPAGEVEPSKEPEPEKSEPGAEPTPEDASSVKAMYDDMVSVLHNPEFQEAYRQVVAKRGQGSVKSEGKPAEPEKEPENPWKAIEPETATEEAMLKAASAQWEAFMALRKDFGELRGGFATIRQSAEVEQSKLTDKQIDTSLSDLKKEFPAVIDGGKKQEEMMWLAADMLTGAKSRGVHMDLGEAMRQAARSIGYGSATDAARKAVQDKAKKSAAARTERPGDRGGSVSEGKDLEGALAAAFDGAQR